MAPGTSRQPRQVYPPWIYFGVAIFVKNPETSAAVRTLASLTGTSLTEAIDRAVRAELAKLQQGGGGPEEYAAKRARLEAATERARRRLIVDAEPEDLYEDATGLPR